MSNFPTPSQIQDQYKRILKAIKPSLNVNDNNSDFIIRGKALTGLLSGLYGDQAKVDNDSFISSMRPESLDTMGLDYDLPRQPSTRAQGPQVQVTGVDGTVIGVGDLTLLYGPTSILYTNTTGGTITGGFLDVAVQCDVAGQIGNIQAPDTMNLVSPPVGVDILSNVIQNIADGSDIETNDSYRARLLTRRQNAPAGGNETDYPQFAFDADPSVRSAFAVRFGRGLGTVDVYITSGTTDIDAAVTAGISVARIPSSTVLNTVQAYYNSHVPLTDCPGVYAPTEINIDVSVNVDLISGITLSSVPSDSVNNPLGLTVQQLIEREVGRVMYKSAVGGRHGILAASDIEEGLDLWLSETEGKLPLLADRQVQKLYGADYNYPLLGNQLPAPGTISVILGV